jgi:hypothetical protein
MCKGVKTSKNCTLNFVVVGGGGSSSGDNAYGMHGGGTVYGSLTLLNGINYDFKIGASDSDTTLYGTNLNIAAIRGQGQYGGVGGIGGSFGGSSIINATIGYGGNGGYSDGFTPPNGGYYSNSGSNGEDGTFVPELDIYYGGGGGGIYYVGGKGGGGDGAYPDDWLLGCNPGAPNTGGGAGGGYFQASGGSGIILFYL